MHQPWTPLHTRPLTTIMAWPILRGAQAVFLAITQDPGVPFTCEGRHKLASSPALGSADVDVSGNSIQQAWTLNQFFPVSFM